MPAPNLEGRQDGDGELSTVEPGVYHMLALRGEDGSGKFGRGTHLESKWPTQEKINL